MENVILNGIPSAFDPSSFAGNWTILVQFGILAVVLLIGNMLRRRVKFFKNMLFPSAIIAGFIGLGLRYLLVNDAWTVAIDGTPIITDHFLNVVTYHTLALGFIALGLKTMRRSDKRLKGRPAKTGLIIANTYLLQGIIGVTLMMLLALFLTGVEPFGGLLLAMGLGQGPAQAGNIGNLYDDFTGNTQRLYFNFGLGIAAVGFLWACIGGVIHLNNKRHGRTRIQRANVTGETSSQQIETAGEIPATDAIDKMSIQVMFVAIVYLVTFLFIYFITVPLENAGNPMNLTGLIWGFNFIFAMAFAFLFKALLNWLQKKKVITRKYTNEYMLDRVAGVVFDFMIVASLMAIDVMVFVNNWQLIVALLITTTAGGFATFFYLKICVNRVYPDYNAEAFACLFGNLTGKASTGIALLREIDPQFLTPAADDLVNGSAFAILFGAPLFLLTTMILEGGEWGWGLWATWGIMIAMFSIFQVLMFIKTKKPLDVIPGREQPIPTVGSESDIPLDEPAK